jgi:hypothetical protein
MQIAQVAENAHRADAARSDQALLALLAAYRGSGGLA